MFWTSYKWYIRWEWKKNWILLKANQPVYMVFVNFFLSMLHDKSHALGIQSDFKYYSVN